MCRRSDRSSIRRRIERRKLDTIPVYLSDIQVLAYFGDMRGRDVVCGAPHALCRLMLQSCENLGSVAVIRKKVTSWVREQGVVYVGVYTGLTWSVNVSQCALSIKVTTRPGASGVPR
jgi:hypothetical protein